MPINKYEVTMYKIGDILYGQNSLNLKVLRVNPDQSVDFQVLSSRAGTLYYYLSTSGSGPWVRVPTDNVLRNINTNMYIQLKVEYGSTQTIEKGLSWWGNYYVNDYKNAPARVVYGNPPYGIYYIPSDTSEVVPAKDQSDAVWRSDFGLDSSWSRVPGSYRWEQSGNHSGFYGWRKETNYGPYRNRYAKRISIKFCKDTTGVLTSGNINIDKIKMYTEEANLLPIRMQYYRGGNVTNHNSIPKYTLDATPASSRFADPELLGPNGTTVKYGINLVWSSDDPYSYTVTYKFKTAHPQLYPDASGSLGSNNCNFTKLGRYEITVTGRLEKYTKTDSFVFTLFDDRDATPPVVKENNPKYPTYVYEMNKDITIFDHYPTFPNFANSSDNALHNIYAYYDFYQFEGEGYDVKLRDSKMPLSSNTKLSEDGQYYMRVNSTYSRNGKSAWTENMFIIDKRIPKVPIIHVNGVRFEGLFKEANCQFFLNSAVATVEMPPYCTPIISVYYRRFNHQKFELYTPSPNQIPEVFKRIGTYKICARSRKTTTGIESTLYTEAVFKVKRKFTHTIEVLPGGRSVDDDTLAYYNLARINFADSVATDTDLGEEDYLEIEKSLNKMYRLNNGSWRYYLDNIYLYDNCAIECMSVDEDGFQSYITRKDIRNIDNTPPPAAKIQVIDGGVTRDIIDGECIMNGATLVIDSKVNQSVPK